MQMDGSYRKFADDLRRISQITLSYQSLYKLFQAGSQKLLCPKIFTDTSWKNQAIILDGKVSNLV
jgi:hypothetical protein